MPNKAALVDAVSAGILSRADADRLDAFWQGRPGWSGDAGSEQPSASAGSEETGEPLLEDSEAPRFSTGFHDILVSLGIGIGGIGLITLVPPFLVLPFIWAMAELVVRRQRLALAAIALTAFWAVASVYMVLMFGIDVASPAFSAGLGDEITARVLYLSAVNVGLFAILMAPFFWRFRVPISLMMVITACVATASLLFAAALSLLVRPVGPDGLHWFYGRVYPLMIVTVMFGAAVWFDLADPARRTRRSDVAFWLHLIVAPLLLFALLSLLGVWSGDYFFLGLVDAPSGQSVVPILLVLLLLLMIGLVLDRRAFVTSGLVSLGTIIGYLISELGLRLDSMFAAAAITLGLIVIVVALGWNPMRRRLLSLFPPALRQRLPIIRGVVPAGSR